MSRIMLNKGLQAEFISNAQKVSSLKWSDIADICGICDRTLRHWRKEKYNMSYEALLKLKGITELSVPKKIQILPEYWSVSKAGRIGAVRRYEIYGNPGTTEGRSKGGRITQKIFRLNPSYARKTGFKIKKEIKSPDRSALFAEFIGIIIGDGTISAHQVRISLNCKEVSYSRYIKGMISKLFDIKPTIKEGSKNTLYITASGKSLVQFLLKNGLRMGNKIKQQIDIPNWIMKKKDFMIACLRGLVDTDGGIYFHTHVTKGIQYRHMGLCFTSLSIPLLNSVEKIFRAIKIIAKNNKINHVSVYRLQHIKEYMNIVCSSNDQLIQRFKSYKGSKVY